MHGLMYYGVRLRLSDRPPYVIARGLVSGLAVAVAVIVILIALKAM
jgi:hypothetical protein